VIAKMRQTKFPAQLPARLLAAFAAGIMFAVPLVAPLPAAAQDTVVAKVNGKNLTEAISSTPRLKLALISVTCLRQRAAAS
jgi:hypothetical protein